MNDKQLYDFLLDAYVEEALNLAVAHLQAQLGIADGDIAGVYFCGENEDKIKGILKGYVNTELSTSRG
jgi:hypothetical protein